MPCDTHVELIPPGRIAEKVSVRLLFLFSGVGGYILLVPSVSVIPFLSPFNEKRVLQIAILIIAGAVLLISRSARRDWISVFCELPGPVRWGLGAVLGLGVLSSSLAPAPSYAFLEVGHFVLMFVAAGGVAVTIQRTPKLQPILFGIVSVSAVLYISYFAVGYSMHLSIPDVQLWPDGATNFDNIRFFNHYQTWTLPLLAGAMLAVPRERLGLRSALFSVVALWWALVFASGVRGTILGMVVAGVGIFLLFRRQASGWLVVQATALLSGVALYYLLFSGGGRTPAVDRFRDPTKYWPRLQHWMVCLEMAWAHPWLGAGPMHFAWPPYQFTEPASPHSALMRWLAEWGIPSTIMMTGLTVWGGRKYMMEEKRRSRHEGTSNVAGISLVASLLAGASHAMVSGILLAPLSQMLLVLVGGWAWGRYQSSGRQRRVTTVSNRGHPVLVMLLVGAIIIVGCSTRDLFSKEERLSAFVEATGSTRLSPRYWRQGYIGIREESVIEKAKRDR